MTPTPLFTRLLSALVRPVDSRARVPESWGLTDTACAANLTTLWHGARPGSRDAGVAFYPMVRAFALGLSNLLEVRVERVVALFVVASTGTKLVYNFVNTVAVCRTITQAQTSLAGFTSALKAQGVILSGRDDKVAYTERLRVVAASHDPLAAISGYRGDSLGARPLAPKLVAFAANILGVANAPATIDSHILRALHGTPDFAPDRTALVAGAATDRAVCNVTPPQAGVVFPLIVARAALDASTDRETFSQTIWSEVTGYTYPNLMFGLEKVSKNSSSAEIANQILGSI